ncbi:Phosphate ABC transporter, periplasmic phosphate-binding protein PstS [Acidisarcina polymorpha]|uniref:Phosphate-binding protein PstS n=1 Tax=Acidisarcina polymorpha TaxID=2211140 RepID=A0A2Z5G827_9BACT|nr:phosphate ABC transporter substrate-binding protein PstS [Acidisarcina polymorpha]AXC15138.1 Phosphate ABC transporter, periplasmic phosphate-binding protein PstS [Acidisarcina polymorpha]
MSDRSSQRRFFVFLSLIGMALLSFTPLRAQTAAALANVRRIYVEPFSGKRGAGEIRSDIIGLLKHDPSLMIVSSVDQSDAVLKGNGEIWTTGYISTNPRANESSRSPIYSGYLSLTLEGSQGQALWSYLVTPAGSFSGAITSNLASHGAKLLLSAVVHEKGSGAPSNESVSTPDQTHQVLKGAGGTFPAPLYQSWIESFHQLHPELQVTYDPVGSEQGIRSLLAQQIDFAASDIPVAETDTSLQRIATVLGAVVPIYNLQGLERSVRFTPEILANIFLGKITRWNDPLLRASNRGLNLPDAAITVIHRSDGSGTTYAFTDFLSRTSPEWKASIGTGGSVRWLVGHEATGNNGVATQVQQIPNSIGYVELTYAIQHELSFGSVRNASGAFVTANLESVATAAESAGDAAASITNAAGKAAYPIASFTWIVLPNPIPLKNRGPITDMLRWMLTNGQKQSSALGYAPLPRSVASRQLESLSTLK